MLTPYEGAVFHGYYQPEGEDKREASVRQSTIGSATAISTG
jgi:hypothetical protein